MRWALVEGNRVLPQSGLQNAVCPGCGGQVVAKCGPILIHHWAHRAVSDCDAWSEPESAWHLEWKDSLAPPNFQEVVVGCHRADVMTSAGFTVEIQHSPLSVESIRERDRFYNQETQGLVWLVDAREFVFEVVSKSKPSHLPDLPDSEAWVRWERPRKSWCFAKSPVFWDVGRGVVLSVDLSFSPWVRVSQAHSHSSFVSLVQDECLLRSEIQSSLWRYLDKSDHWADTKVPNPVQSGTQNNTRLEQLVQERDVLKGALDTLSLAAKGMGLQPSELLSELKTLSRICLDLEVSLPGLLSELDRVMMPAPPQTDPEDIIAAMFRNP